MKKNKKNKKRKSSQKRTFKSNNVTKKKNEWKSKLIKTLAWVVATFFAAVIATCVSLNTPILLKNFSVLPPSLGISRNEICVNSLYRYYAYVSGDTIMERYLVIETGKAGNISINLTNNDESTLIVNDIYIEVFDYQPITEIVLSEGMMGGSYSEPIYYGVHLDNVCKEYKCTLLDKEGARFFTTYYELPNETNFKFMGEQIEYNKTDEIEIIFSPQDQGIYRFKILVDYSIRNFNNRIESDEFNFISLDSSFISQN